VAIGFEHSIANWFMLPFALAVDPDGVVSIAGFGMNIVAVTAGNLIGGTLLVAGVYWLAYLRGSRVKD
jgi:formate/nitrite transporter FocA (FNT family)